MVHLRDNISLRRLCEFNLKHLPRDEYNKLSKTMNSENEFSLFSAFYDGGIFIYNFRRINEKTEKEFPILYNLLITLRDTHKVNMVDFYEEGDQIKGFELYNWED